MKNTLLIASCLTLSMVASSFANPNIKIANLKKDVTYLSSKQLHGRLALTEGDNEAINWIAKQFAKAGLKPLQGSDYRQKVNLIEFKPEVSKSYLSMQQQGSITKWKNPDLYLAFPDKVNVTAPVVFVGYGITAPELQYDDYKDVDVKAKIVLLFEHEPQEGNPHSIFNGTANTIYSNLRIKALNAQKHGAIAVLLAPEPNRKHPSNQERRARVKGALSQTYLVSQVLDDDELHIPVALISDKVAEALVSDKFSLSEMQAAIDSTLNSKARLLSNIKVTLHNENVYSKKGISYNVAGLLPGYDPVLKNETIIISAHHDHDGQKGNLIWHGADDNASGTVGVINLAKAFAVQPEALKRSLLFVVFTSEERGLLGSYYMAEHPLRPLESTRAMINLDMIGRNETRSKQTDGLIKIPKHTNNRLNLIGSHYSPDYQKVIVEQNKFVGLTLDNRFDEENALNVFSRSDQFPFMLHNIPAFWWFTGFHPDYHQITDTADKINYKKMANILKLAYMTTCQLANDVKVPQFIKNPGGKVE